MKIIILQNHITDQSTLDAGIALAKSLLSSIDFPLELTTKVIDQIFTAESLNIPTLSGGGFAVKPQEILPLISGISADIACLVYDWTKVTPQPTNPCQSDIQENGCTPIQIPCQWYANFPEVFAEFFLHEICHAMYYLSNNSANDKTHYQYQNPAYSQKTPTSYYLYLITELMQYFPSMQTATIIRNPSDSKETIGKLSVNGFTCDTLELPWLDNQRNISCIPAGEYLVTWTFSGKLLKYTYEIQNVPNRSGIRIHAANYYSEIEGCIALGTDLKDINGDDELDAINSKAAVDSFVAIMGKKPFTLKIA